MTALSPLLVPLLALVVAIISAFAIFERQWGGQQPPRSIRGATIIAAVIAAAAPNLRQTLCDIGFSPNVVHIVANASYFVFFFALVGAWIMLGRNRKRLALLLLVPIAMLEPMKWAFALFAWSVNGFAP